MEIILTSTPNTEPGIHNWNNYTRETCSKSPEFENSVQTSERENKRWDAG